MEKELITHYCAVLGVRDVMTSIDFYCFKLGFDLVTSYGTPPYYGEVKRGQGQHLMFLDQASAGALSTHVSLAFYSEDIDALYEEFEAKAVPIKAPLENKVYGMREFQLEDPNGYLLVFRQRMK